MNKKICILATMLLLYASCEKIETPENDENEININCIVDEQTKAPAENVIKNLSVFQFDHSTGKLVRMQYSSSYNYNTTKITLLSPKNKYYDVYFIANAGDLTGKYTVGKSLKSKVDTSTFAVPSDGSLTLIPMSGKYYGYTNVQSISVVLKRALSKISVITNTSLGTDYSELSVGEISIKSVPSRGSFFSIDGIYPKETASFLDYPPQNFKFGDTITWYIPENKRGTNSSITDEEGKNLNTMPSPHCTRVSMSIGYRHYHLFDYGEANIILGGNIKSDFNIIRNTHYTYKTNITSLTDSRIQWHSTSNTIPYLENGTNFGNGVFYYKNVWAPVNLGKDEDNPVGKFYFLLNQDIFQYSSWDEDRQLVEEKVEGDPCPPGWRIPSSSEFGFITSGDFIVQRIYKWTWDNGLKYSSDYLISDTLYLPTTGYIKTGFDILFAQNEGWYLSCHTYNTSGIFITFSRTSSGKFTDFQRKDHSKIRCIFDGPDYLRHYYQLNN